MVGGTPAGDGASYLRGCALVGVALLTAGWIVAAQTPVPGWEIDVFDALNDVPEWVADVFWLPMQLGNVIALVVIALVAAALYRSLRFGIVIVVAAALALLVSELVKRIVDRGRPAEVTDNVIVRQGDGDGLGFPSSTSSMVFALTMVVALNLPAWARVVAFVVATAIGVARVIYGVHLPADIAGGAGLGLLVGALALHVLALAEDRISTST